MRRRLVSFSVFLALAIGLGALAQDGLDLPIRHPGDPVPAPPPSATVTPTTVPVPPVSPPPPADDPHDEPLPTFWGEEISSESCSIVFVLDASGSMLSWATPPVSWWTWETPRGEYHTIPGHYRWDRAVEELDRCLAGLSRPWRFGVVAYPNCTVVGWAGNMAPAEEPYKASALEWTRGVRVEGATGTAAAVISAFKLDSTATVVLLTDGGPNCGQSAAWHRRTINNANSARQIVNVFGIDASGDYRAFCQGVAADSGGSYYDVR